MSTEVTNDENFVLSQLTQDVIEKIKNENQYTKHSLSTKWTVWFLIKQAEKKGGYAKDTRVIDIETVEDFFALYNTFIKPSQIGNNIKTNVIFLRQNNTPEWENEFNINGGEWICDFDKKSFRSQGCSKLDEAWEKTLFSIIGGSWKDADDISGIFLHLRSKMDDDKISIWNSNSDDDLIVQRIGKTWHDLLQSAGVEAPKMGYSLHADALHHAKHCKGRYEVKPKFQYNNFRVNDHAPNKNFKKPQFERQQSEKQPQQSEKQ